MSYFKRKLIIYIIIFIIIINIAHASERPALYSNKTSNFHPIIIYYGWLNTSNLLNLSANIVVVAGSERILPGGPDNEIVSKLRSNGVEVYAYLEDLNGDNSGGTPNGDTSDDTPVSMGLSFKSKVIDNSTGTFKQRVKAWVNYIESLIYNYDGVVTGVFLDGCDPSYFTDNVSSFEARNFSEGLKNITAYAHSKNLKVIINGVMGYASLADWYLWEEFLVTYDYNTGQYKLLSSFLKETPYDSDLRWVNGISRYLYLRDHNLLDKTIAVTFADTSHPETIEWANAAYLLARIMGLAGWGYANYNFYSEGGPVPIGIVNAYEAGPSISDPSFTDQKAWRVFAIPGNVTITISQDTTNIDLVPGWPFPVKRIEVDGVNNNEYKNFLQEAVKGDESSLNYAGVNMTPTGLYLYAEWSYASQASSGGLLHIYIDADGDASTGYHVDNIGADYLIEVYTDGTAHLYSYTGSGSDWSWEDEGTISSIVNSNGLEYTGEFATNRVDITVGEFELIFAVVYNWNDDAVSPAIQISDVYVYQPTIFEDTSKLTSYTGIVNSITINYMKKATIIADGPSGVTVNYTIIVPFSNIETVYVDGSPISEGGSTPPTYTSKQILDGSYSKVTVLVTHHSPVNITILAEEPQPVPEPSILSIIIASEALIIAIILAVRRTSIGGS